MSGVRCVSGCTDVARRRKVRNFEHFDTQPDTSRPAQPGSYELWRRNRGIATRATGRSVDAAGEGKHLRGLPHFADVGIPSSARSFRIATSCQTYQAVLTGPRSASDLPTGHVRADQRFGVAAHRLAKARDGSQIGLLWRCASALLCEGLCCRLVNETSKTDSYCQCSEFQILGPSSDVGAPRCANSVHETGSRIDLLRVALHAAQERRASVRRHPLPLRDQPSFFRRSRRCNSSFEGSCSANEPVLTSPART